MNKKYGFLSFIGLLNFILLMFMTSKLPDIVPTHVGMNNTIDGMGSKWYIAIVSSITFIMPIFIGIYKKYTKEQSNVTKGKDGEFMIFLAVNLLLVAISWFSYALSASGLEIGDKLSISLNLVLGIPISLLFIFLGNYMGVIKKNFYLGIRTPWTLMDETVWHKTHRLGGFLFTLGGFIMLICCIVGHYFHIDWLFVAGTIAATIFASFIPMLYSFFLYSKIQREKNSNK